MNDRILCVDDDLNILAAFQRQLRGQFQIVSALGGAQALKTISERGPFAVVVSDLQMPGMCGMEFLSHVHELSPESVRIIFSGRADLNSAILAVNQGNIFRFLTKPCPPDLLARTLSQALDQHQLIVAERELLEKTLQGSVQVLVDILALLNPTLFSRSSRIQNYVMHIAASLDANRWKWQLELAAMLSQIGCVALSPDLARKLLATEPLSAGEQAEYDSHPSTGARLIANIPRLELVAEIISLQRQAYRQFAKNTDSVVDFGAQALRAAIDFDKLRSGSLGCAAAVEVLRAAGSEYNPVMVAALATLESSASPMRRMQLRALEMKPKMITLADVYAADGVLLLARDQEISGAMVEVLRNFAATRGVREPIDVLAPVAPVPSTVTGR